MYEEITDTSPSEPYKTPKIQVKTGKSQEERSDEIACREEREMDKGVRRGPGPSNGIKINYKDLKKEEKKRGGMTIPFLPDLVDYVCDNTCCQSLKVNGNLFIPCGTNVKGWSPNEEAEEGETVYGFPVCKTCRKQGNVEKYGSLKDRMACYERMEVYEAPDQEQDGESVDEDGKKKRQVGPKREVTFATFLAKKGDLGKDAKQRPGILAEKVREIESFLLEEFQFSYTLPESALKIDNTKVRGKKTGDGDKKKRGRPGKRERSASVESSSSEEDVAKQEKETIVSEEGGEVENVVEKKPEAKKQGASKKKTVKADDGAKKTVKPKKKVVQPKKKVPEPEPEPEQEAEELEEGEIEEHSEEEVENVAKSVAKKQGGTKKAPEPEDVESDVESLEAEEEGGEDEDQEEEVRPFTYKGKKYFMDNDYTVYDESQHYIGDYDPKTGKIEFIN